MKDDRWSDLQALAPAFALGVLEPDDRAEFEAALVSSAELQQEVDRYSEVAAALGIGLSEVTPPTDLKARLMARIRKEEEPLMRDLAHARSVDFDSIDWVEPKRGAGFDVYWLRRDQETGEMAVLLRGLPGATYPDHLHPGGEQFFILHGTCADHRADYKAGDSYIYPPGSIHRNLRVTGDDPCVLLVITGPGGIQLLEHEAGAH